MSEQNVKDIVSRDKEVQERLIVKSLEIKPDYSNLKSYSEIKDQIKPFDVIAFRGSGILGELISTLEKHSTGVGAFTHVGMVVTSDILASKDLEAGKLYLLESTITTNGVPDVINHNYAMGVQLRDLAEVIPRYIVDKNCKVAWCRLIDNPYREKESWLLDKIRHHNISKKFADIFENYHNREYELDAIGLLGSMFPSLRGLRDKRDEIYNALFKVMSIFGSAKMKDSPGGWQMCSELIINIYQELGIVPRSFDPRDVLPVDFFGYDKDWLPALVEAPIFIKDWDIPGQPAISY